MSLAGQTIRPPSQPDRARTLLRALIDRCSAALFDGLGCESLLRDAVHDALHDFDTCGLEDPRLRAWVIAQLRAIEFEPDKVAVHGPERLRHRLEYVRIAMGSYVV